MKIRELYERIRKRVYVCSNDKVKSFVIPQGIEEAVCVDLTNVNEWRDREKTSDDFLSMCPNRLPFPSMWFEYPILVADFYNQARMHSGNMGVLAQETGLFDNPVGVISFSVFLYDSTDDWCCLTAMGGLNTEKMDLQRFPQYVGPSFGTDLSAEEVTDQNFERAMNTIIPSLVFFNCKNVELRKIERSRKAIKSYNRKHIAPPEFHVIEIHNQSVRNVYEGGISTKKILRHAAMVRGHFKTYTEDNKLFGKKTGTWFWQSHVRGDFGIPTVRDYRVHEPKHKGPCIM